MVFNNIADGNGLIQEEERITGLGAGAISGNNNLLKDFTARTNNALDRFYALVWQYDQLWNFDDRKYADTDLKLPIASTNIVSGQADYLFASELLGVTQVFVKDSSGVFHEIHPQIDTESPNVYTDTTTGIPTNYELVGNSVILTPTPNYSSTLGLKITFKRNGTKFTYTDGAVAVGIPTLFHPYLAREASQGYLQEKNKASKIDNARDIAKDEMSLKSFISNRARPKRIGLRVKQEDNR